MNRLALFVEHFVLVGIEQVIRHTAELAARTSVGTAVRQHFADVAASRIGYAQRTVYKGFQFDIRHGLMDSAYLVNAQFARQHHALEPQVAQVSYMLRRAVVALRGSVQTNRG